MNDKDTKLSFTRILVTIIAIGLIAILVEKGIALLKNLSQICVVEYGLLKYEETAEAFILRDETILQGENYKNGMVQIISDGKRVAKNEAVFRYYSNGEEEILKQIEVLDEEINAAIETSGLKIFSNDITNLEKQIEKSVSSMYCLNDIEKMKDKISELNIYINKKTKITGSLSPADSHVKSLIEERNALEMSLSNSSEIVTSPLSGLISYRVDGLEQVLRSKRFELFNIRIVGVVRDKIRFCNIGK